MDLHAVFFTLILLTWTGVSFGQELLLPEGITNRAVGDDVEIIPLSTPNRPYILVRWAFNGTYILTSHPGGVDILPPYTDRAGLNTTTLALTLMRLRESDTGKYSLTVETSAQTFTAVTSLQVLMLPSNVTIVPSKTELVEYNSSVSLVCSASGSSLSFIWLNGTSEVTEGERVQLTDRNSTLTITSVIRVDTGPYQCEASNIISKTSPPIVLTVYYGPENVEAIDPGKPFYISGSNVILTCSAESSPDAEFQWAVNGTGLGVIGQKLSMNNIQSSQSGNYTCIAHNKHTLRYSTSKPISITVTEKGCVCEAAVCQLSGGAIAMIVIGVLLGVAGIASLIFYFVKAKEMSRKNSRGNNQSGKTNIEDESDSKYENFPPNKSKVTVSGSSTQMHCHTPQSDKGDIYENVIDG